MPPTEPSRAWEESPSKNSTYSRSAVPGPNATEHPTRSFRSNDDDRVPAPSCLRARPLAHSLPPQPGPAGLPCTTRLSPKLSAFGREGL